MRVLRKGNDAFVLVLALLQHWRWPVAKSLMSSKTNSLLFFIIWDHLLKGLYVGYWQLKIALHLVFKPEQMLTNVCFLFPLWSWIYMVTHFDEIATSPIQLKLHEKSLNVSNFAFSEKVSIWYFVFKGAPTDCPEAPFVENIKLINMWSVWFVCLFLF